MTIPTPTMTNWVIITMTKTIARAVRVASLLAMLRLIMDIFTPLSTGRIFEYVRIFGYTFILYLYT